MALARASCVVMFYFFALGSATICSYNSECDQLSGEFCCSDSVCRKTCYYCTFDTDCGTGEQCCDGGDCLSDCPSSSNGSWAAILGAVFGTIVFFAIIISFVACFCCACCPYYRNRSQGTVVMTQPTTHQTFVSTSTHVSTMSGQPVQHPPPGPPPVNYNQPPPPNYNQVPPPPNYSQVPPPNYNQVPPPPGYDQATSPYNPSYSQQPVHYTPPSLQRQSPTAPSVQY